MGSNEGQITRVCLQKTLLALIGYTVIVQNRPTWVYTRNITDGHCLWVFSMYKHKPQCEFDRDYEHAGAKYTHTWVFLTTKYRNTFANIDMHATFRTNI